MRKLINSTYITLDEVIENPMWTGRYFDDGATAFAGRQNCGGRRDRDGPGHLRKHVGGVAEPGRGRSRPRRGLRQQRPKVCRVQNADRPAWRKTRGLQSDLIDAVAALKAEDGQDILRYGYGTVTTS